MQREIEQLKKNLNICLLEKSKLNRFIHSERLFLYDENYDLDRNSIAM